MSFLPTLLLCCLGSSFAQTDEGPDMEQSTPSPSTSITYPDMEQTTPYLTTRITNPDTEQSTPSHTTIGPTVSPTSTSEEACEYTGWLRDYERNEIIKYHNKLREEIAKGKADNYIGKLNPAKNMYMLKYSCKLEKIVQAQLNKEFFNITIPGYGQNIARYALNYVDWDHPMNMIRIGLESWSNPVRYYGLRNSLNKYNDARLYSFANMIYAKAFRFGCGFTVNHAVVTVSCIYNLIGAYPNNILYETGRRCKKHRDCTTYLGSRCDKATGLCKYSGRLPVPGGEENTVCENNRGGTDRLREKALEAHNKRRGLLAMGQVHSTSCDPKWNLPTASYMRTLKYDCYEESEAIKYAKTCSFKESEDKENVFVYPIPNVDPVIAIEAATEHWWSQVNARCPFVNNNTTFVDEMMEEATDQTAFSKMAWADTAFIGCATQTCFTSTFVVCRYSPAGFNTIGAKVYMPGQPCSNCTGFGHCIKSEGMCTFPFP
ncbi:unnamed protein product [Cylicocyclus nassatus]|uniref:SCP domain-containing protein n=1 Tax=Cylicocyclus nassatus TaxID=53992 RepID=A0AA36GJ75_CYLNA|nr:unnamed protein product [Cylicocyclus nassatus]